MRKIGMVIALCLILFQAHAELTLPRVFADHMVLQRGQEIPVWGKADPRKRVIVTFQGEEYRVRADRDGNWKLEMDAFPKGGPYTLSVNTNNESVVFENVMMGDVWVLGGQSNMEWALKNTNNGEDSIKVADYPNIRLFEVGRDLSLKPLDDVAEAKWSVCTPASVENFSAIGYYFARRIQADLDVPIGLLDINWGGTVSEAWTSAEALATHEDFSERIATNQAEGPTDFSDPEVRRPNNWPTSLFTGCWSRLFRLRSKGHFGIKANPMPEGPINTGRSFH